MAKSSRDDDKLRSIIARVLDLRTNAVGISPTVIATEAMSLIDSERKAPALVQLGCHLQLRQIAREMLRGKYQPDGDADDDAQHSLWPDLQRRYPTARSAHDAEPEYVLLEQLTDADLTYNVARLRKEGNAKLRHADALEVWGRENPWGAAAQ